MVPRKSLFVASFELLDLLFVFELRGKRIAAHKVIFISVQVSLFLIVLIICFWLFEVFQCWDFQNITAYFWLQIDGDLFTVRMLVFFFPEGLIDVCLISSSFLPLTVFFHFFVVSFCWLWSYESVEEFWIAVRICARHFSCWSILYYCWLS